MCVCVNYIYIYIIFIFNKNYTSYLIDRDVICVFGVFKYSTVSDSCSNVLKIITFVGRVCVCGGVHLRLHAPPTVPQGTATAVSHYHYLITPHLPTTLLSSTM